ncbi:hypothetical protein [Parafrankia sp. EUN1f]|uniref:hypothetical protein n=1 Tax=Parafrankia sp. EUN1f TaxID=102897 RepID=UPI0001C45304|nr:hypothetical protein [Parafrankia sp. EUN1f]EFC78989.1 hypothetical protein FrEUN1fDRAFT_7893 [Parafrankia sp. EUN1f]
MGRPPGSTKSIPADVVGPARELAEALCEIRGDKISLERLGSKVLLCSRSHASRIFQGRKLISEKQLEAFFEFAGHAEPKRDRVRQLRQEAYLAAQTPRPGAPEPAETTEAVPGDSDRLGASAAPCAANEGDGPSGGRGRRWRVGSILLVTVVVVVTVATVVLVMTRRPAAAQPLAFTGVAPGDYVAWCFRLKGAGSAVPGREVLVVVTDPASDVYRLGDPVWQDAASWTLSVQVGTGTSSTGGNEHAYELLLLVADPGLPGLRDIDPRPVDRALFDHYIDRGDIVVVDRRTVRRAEDTSSCETGLS